MARRRTLLLLALLALAVGVYALYRLPDWSARFLADSLSGFFHRPVRVGSVRFELFPLQAEVRDVAVAGLTADAPPFLEVVRAQVTPSLAPVRGRQIVLSRIRIEGLRVLPGQVGPARVRAPRAPARGPATTRSARRRPAWGRRRRPGRRLREHPRRAVTAVRVPVVLAPPAVRVRLAAVPVPRAPTAVRVPVVLVAPVARVPAVPGRAR